MAEIVIGIASSHTPQLSSGVDMWSDHAERDRRNPRLLGKDAHFHTYDELLATADPGLARELDPAVWEEKYQRSQDAIEALTADCAMLSASAARVTCWRSATATKTRSCSSVMSVTLSACPRRWLWLRLAH